jgi:hypothetical protein
MKDKCVLCGVETLYERTDHVDFRLGYVEGAGQLCLDCYGMVNKNSSPGQGERGRGITGPVLSSPGKIIGQPLGDKVCSR